MSDKSFDNQFASSQYINFYPYVGKDYVNSQHKILMLGDSHYGKQKNDFYHGWTREVVEDDFLGNYDNGRTLPDWAECHRNAANVFVMTRGDNPHSAYDKMAFYNFFQRRVGDGNHADKRFITEELKILSAKALAEVVEILCPELIVGWGWTLESEYLPEKVCGDVIKKIAGINLHLFYLNNYPQIPFWCMRHPSEWFNIDVHRECFAELKKYLGW
jgi:hypothetical protein